jgi:PAN domain
MKACPTCNRTYADETLTFCLVDGSVLSAPYDPHETMHLPAPRATDPMPTQPPLPSTIQSPQALPLYPEKPQSQLKEKQGGNPWMGFGIAMSLVSLVAIGVLISFIWFGKDRVAGNQSNENVTNTNARPTATPTATIEGGSWGPMQHASINQGDGQLLTYYGGTTPEQCQADCEKNPKCKAFTFIRPGAYGPNDPPMCYLMSEVQRLTPSSCCITAIKR